MFKNKEMTSPFDRRNNFIQNRSNENKQTKSKAKYFTMNESEFPNISLHKTTQQHNTLNYLDKLNTEEKVVVQDDNELKPGWLEIKFDPITRNKTINYAKSKKNYNVNTNNEEDTYIVMLNELTNKYIRWKNDYIEKWGEYEYESLYLFTNCDHNYDYDYFDDLIEEYLIEDREYNYIEEDV